MDQDISKFFCLGSMLEDRFVQVSAKALLQVGAEEPHKGIYQNLKLPVIFTYESGQVWGDTLDTGWVALHLISDAVVAALVQAQLTGWKTFAVDVRDKRGRPVLGYQGLSRSEEHTSE